VVRKLEEADASRLAAIGWRPAQVFTVKARDGITDLHGVIYLPPRLDSMKKYPIIDHIYPGPQVGSVGSWSFKGGGEPFSLAELGFVVIQLDHLGTPFRSKAFHDNYYGNFGDNGLPDHIAAIKQLAARYGFIDVERVGIFGHSGGGFASTDAMLRYPDFFKVAVSGSGNHDNRSYNIYWSEKYQGLMTRDSARKTDNFETSANKTMAKNLRGHLLLMHGDMDDNVHPANTIQLVDELIKANRTFDLIIAPNRAHGLNEPYFIRRRWDYFVQHLLGAAPPDNYEITRPPDAAGGAGNVTPDEDLPSWR
jgi:dipeptidyl aminopeptidase/acylaminoacyl peptidase